ncbi:PTS lactose/cellobiose transporter subunit IIA [Lentilactobacillus kisonensis]|uniref:PTS system, Lactose Cellobiose specific IIA subunit n=1 Tax=Lentilactobacillus kisonensis DSM 19906 = JCM 15041 TaxID=1423766 RepID=A0A0R1NNF4_9LACO|nr:PTS lactose/cellobiose transporter subunit IIA [Lentilactobacillus kisonensis]KRL21950.1 hypothetical protein FC98_GL000513 [Lentilactobacillus kisonensis DSM 19906 = JCM 15041]
MNVDDLNQLSMQILTDAGNAKKILSKAVDNISISTYDKEQIGTQFAQAHEWLVKGHNEQNKVVKYVDSLQYSVLFTHAQDTLTNTETMYFLLKKLLPLIMSKK